MRELFKDMLKAPIILYETYKEDKRTHKVLPRFLLVSVLTIVGLNLPLAVYLIIRPHYLNLNLEVSDIIAIVLMLIITIISLYGYFKYMGRLFKPYFEEEPKQHDKK